jgi:hypothetical protein
VETKQASTQATRVCSVKCNSVTNASCNEDEKAMDEKVRIKSEHECEMELKWWKESKVLWVGGGQ